MLVICLKRDDPSLLLEAQKWADAIEYRLDLLPSLSNLEKLCKLCKKPLLLAVGADKALAREALRFNPVYLDLDSSVDPSFVKEIRELSPRTTLICSVHDYEKTPDLESIQFGFQADLYKVAAYAKTSSDALRLLQWGGEHPRVAVCPMGEKGKIGRILAPITGSLFTYASLSEEEETAPGQIPAATLLETYRWEYLHPKTPIYALIGNPVFQSPSHITSNILFSQLRKEGVYVKIPLEEEEIAPFASYMRSLPFQGVSVTVPYKERALSLADSLEEDARAIGAINTLYKREGEWIGANTDGIGAADAIEKKRSIRGLKVLVLGTGGTARAILYECKKRGGETYLWGRSPDKVEELSAAFKAQPITAFDQHPWDVIVNATSIGMLLDALPCPPSSFSEGAIALDVVFSKEKTLFLKEAEKKGCHLIEGRELFILQGAAQFSRFLGVDSTLVEQCLRDQLEPVHL